MILTMSIHGRKKTRGYEIKKYLKEHPEIQYYVIIDDENQFLPEQQHHFIHIINDWTGFGYLEFKKFEDIYMRDKGHGSSHWDPKEPYKDTAMLKVDDCCYLGMQEPVEEIIFSSKNNRVQCTPDYILAHDAFSINGVKFKKVEEDELS